MRQKKTLAFDEFNRPFRDYLCRISDIGLLNHNRGLDAGCGLGNWSIPLATLNHLVTGVDIDEQKLEASRKLANSMSISNLDFQKHSFTKLPFRNGEFDFIICYFVIMYTDADKVLDELNRVLAPNGKLYIMTDLWRWLVMPPNKTFFELLLYRVSLIVLRMKGVKYRYFTRSSFERLIKSKGFRIISKGSDGESSFKEEKELKIRNKGFYNSPNISDKYLFEICAIKN
jgi:ubiquinone/menaquinone biosynthesis C-methylase UbiE